MWRLFPQIRGSLASLGISILVYGIFALALLGCACGVAFSLRLPVLRLVHRLRLLALWVCAADLIAGCLCMGV